MAQPPTPPEPASAFADYLSALPPERAALVSRVVDLVDGALPSGYVRVIDYGMPTWVVPLEDYPDTYNGHALGVAALAAQKNYTSLYLHGVYASAAETAAFRATWAAAGKKLDMGKSCVRFRTFEDLVPEAIVGTLSRTPPSALIALHEQAHPSG